MMTFSRLLKLFTSPNHIPIPSGLDSLTESVRSSGGVRNFIQNRLIKSAAGFCGTLASCYVFVNQMAKHKDSYFPPIYDAAEFIRNGVCSIFLSPPRNIPNSLIMNRCNYQMTGICKNYLADSWRFNVTYTYNIDNASCVTCMPLCDTLTEAHNDEAKDLFKMLFWITVAQLSCSLAYIYLQQVIETCKAIYKAQLNKERICFFSFDNNNVHTATDSTDKPSPQRILKK